MVSNVKNVSGALGASPQTPEVLAGMGQTFLWNGRKEREETKRFLPPSAFHRMRWHRLFLEWMRFRRATLCFTGCSKDAQRVEVKQDPPHSL